MLRRPARRFVLVTCVLAMALVAAPLAHAQVFTADDYPQVFKNSSANDIDVLANDSADNGTEVITGFQAASDNGGTVNCGSGTSCLYTPANNFVGSDQFTYTAQDDDAIDATATVYVDVVPNEADIYAYTYGASYQAGTSDPFTYSLVVGNGGPVDATTVSTDWTLPAGVTNVQLPNPNTYNCNTATLGHVKCTIPTLAAYDSVQIDITLNAPSSATTMHDYFTASAASPTDPYPSNNVAEGFVPVLDGADVAMYTASGGDVANGDHPEFNTWVYNFGPKTADVHLVNSISGGTLADGAITGCTKPDVDAVDCLLPGMTADSDFTANFAVVPTDGTDSLVVNQASITSSQPDPYPYDQNGIAAAAVGNPLLADVSVWTGGNSLLGPSEDTSFYLEGYNAGPNPAAGMQVHWTAPTGVTVTSIDAEPTSLNCTHTTTSVTCNPGSFPVNQWFSVIVNATVAASPTPGTYSADASVTSTTGDRYPADNTSSFPVHVLGPGQTDLEAGIYGPDVVANNVRAHYTAWVYNNGPSDTTGATLTLDLPPLTSYYNTTNDAPTATMDGATCTFSVANHNIVCSGIAIQKYNWKSVEVGITPTVPGNSLPITALLSATVAKAGDPIPENDSAQFYATVYPEGSSDLLVQQTDSADPAAVGEPLKYTVTTLNRGPFAAPNVTVTNTLPSGVTFVSAKRSDGTSCPAPSGLVITCGIGDLQPYDAKAIVVTVTPNSTGPITNTVTATAGSGTDPETANNTGITEGTDVVPDVADSSQASTSTGTVVVDPDTGEVLVTVPRGNPSAVTVQTTAVCPAGQVEDVSFTLGNGPGAAQFNATNTSGSIWSATIPQDQLQSADIYAHVHCNPPNQTYVNQVGTIHLYDPSGVITDADTGAPIAGATVTLYRVPGWSARISPAQNTTPNTCESNLSRAGDWSQAAPTNLGVAADPSSGMIDPAANPLKTTAQGRYGWNVAAGCWYVVVSKTGYTTLTSPVVGVPSEVTDLDLKLHKVTSGGGSSGGGGGGGDGGGSGGGDGGGTPTTTTTTPPTSSVSTPQTTTATPPAKTKCVVPKLVGLSLAKAKKALAKAHCGVGKISKKKAKAKIKGKKPKKGTVIAQLPKAGTKKPAGSKVAITLAK